MENNNKTQRTAQSFSALQAKRRRYASVLRPFCEFVDPQRDLKAFRYILQQTRLVPGAGRKHSRDEMHCRSRTARDEGGRRSLVRRFKSRRAGPGIL